MHLFVLGVSHHTAPVDLRERVDFSRRGISQALAELAERPGTHEAVVLSTCNRAEVYVTCDDPSHARRDLAAFMSHFHGVPPDQLASHLFGLIDADAARHLFRVAAGLDSLVVGEPQILGQVKVAYTGAADRRSTGAVLNRLFHWSFAVGKRVRSETGLGEGAVSVSYAAVALARKIFGSLHDLSVLLIGAGEMAELTATHLRAQQVRRIAVASRTGEHAAALAAQVGGVTIPWTAVTSELAASDIVVTATGSTQPLVTRTQVQAAMHARRNRPLFIIDIAVPRDVEALAGEIEQVFLYNIDDLRTIVNENLARRRAQVEHADALVADEVEGFMAWLRSRAAVPTLVALRRRFEAIRQAELTRFEPKLSALSPASRKRVDEVTRLIVEKLLHTPTEQLKALSDRDTVAIYSDALSQLFSLTEAPAEADTSDAAASGTGAAAPSPKNSVPS